MGRYINCDRDTIYKYALGAQSSEMGVICNEYGIGQHKEVSYFDEEDGPDGDELLLSSGDIPKLRQLVDRLRAEQGESYRLSMIEAILDYMVRHPDRDEFLFEGEY